MRFKKRTRTTTATTLTTTILSTTLTTTLTTTRQKYQTITRSARLQIITTTTTTTTTTQSEQSDFITFFILLQDGAKVAVKSAGGLPPMVSLLSRSGNAKFLAVVADCLQLLSFGDAEAKAVIHECDGGVALVRIVKTFGDYEKLMWTASRVLKV